MQNFHTGDGLAHNDVGHVVEDSRGVMWFATGGGISLYDGIGWETFVKNDRGEPFAQGYGSVPGSLGLFGDRSGQVWVPDNAGILRHDGTGWRRFTRADGLPSDTVTAFAQDSSGHYWFGSYGAGISRFDGSSWRTFSTRDVGITNDQHMTVDGAGRLWVTDGSDLARFNGTSWDTLAFDDYIFAIYGDRSGRLWVGTFFTGVWCYDGTSWRTYTTSDGLPLNQVSAVLEDHAGNLWFGTYGGGITRFDGKRWRTFETLDGLTDGHATDLIQDHCGNLWVANYNWSQGGASRFDGESWTRYHVLESTGNGPFAMAQDSLGAYWFGTDWGATRFDGRYFTYFDFSTASGIYRHPVRAICTDRTGNVWLATSFDPSSSQEAGVLRYDGTSFTAYRQSDGLASNRVSAILLDHAGNLWFGTTGDPFSNIAAAGLTRYDGTHWTTYTTADGLANDDVSAIFEDHLGRLWITTASGVSLFDGVTWRTLTTADGLPSNSPAITQDTAGNFWFGYGPLTRFDGTTWTTIGVADGLPSNSVGTVHADRDGVMWAATEGVSFLKGSRWRTIFTIRDGFAIAASTIDEDRAGSLVFGGYGSAWIHDPDRVAPQTVLSSRPRAVSTSRTQSATFVAAYGENQDIEFSYSLDGGTWSAWSPVGSWSGVNLDDGSHALAVRARDWWLNVDPVPAVATFEIDATPPEPLVTTPASRQAVRDSIVITGTAADPRFKAFAVAVRSAGATSWSPPTATVLATSISAVTEGVLAGWNTASFPDGDYEIRIAVTDTLGLTGSATVRVIVDNDPPFASQTSPARIDAASGGDVYTTNAEAHLYFPPHAFTKDAIVTVSPLSDADAPATLPNGAVRVAQGYDIGWAGADLAKAADLELSVAGSADAPSKTRAIYELRAGEAPLRIGGTVDAAHQRIAASMTESGKYAVYADAGPVDGPSRVSSISLTPRVFSPRGRFANPEIAIGFTLGRAGTATIKVYNRSGRLVREVVSGAPMNAGANLVRWNGRGDDGAIVTSGIYLVSVEALGQQQTRTLAVVD